MLTLRSSSVNPFKLHFLNSFWAIRLLSLALVFILRRNLHEIDYFSLFYAFLFSHYLLALGAAGSHIKSLLVDRERYLLLAFLLLLYCGLTLQAIPHLSEAHILPLLIYFGIHHVFNDVYVLQGTLKNSSHPDYSFLIAARLALNFSCYLVVFWQIVFPRGNALALNVQIGYFLLMLSTAALILALYRARNLLDKAAFFDIITFEAIAILVAIFFAGRVSFLDIIFYHLVFWLMYPVRKNISVQRHLAVKSLLKNVAWTLVFFLATPAARLGIGFSIPGWLVAANLVGYFHITSSLVISKLNPRFLRPA